MRVNWNVIKLVLILIVLGLLYGFTQARSVDRNLAGLDVKFVDENDPLITLSTVNKLLIQNNDSVTGIGKETLVLNELESRLMGNPMIRDAEVFITVDGKLGANIEQRNPIARVGASPNYYLDEDGKKMPLSKVYAARVPLITGSSKNNFRELTPLILKIREDNFMNMSVVGVHLRKDGIVELSLRKHDFKVFFGKPERIDKKFQNFKAFYQKTKRDNTLNGYRTVSLQFGNQVVATKK